MQDEYGILHFLYPMPPRKAASLPVALLAGSARRLAREGLRGRVAACPFTANREAARDKARSAATNRPGRPAQRGRTGRQQGPAAAQAEPEPPTDKAARQGAGTARNDPPQAGAQSEPPSPRVKIPHRGPEQGPTGEGGRRESAPRGEGGEPPRGRAPYPADATEATSTAEQGAGRSARRHQEREQRSSTVLTPGRKTTQRARVGRASRRNDSGAGRRPTGPTATAPSAPRSAGSGNGFRLAAGAATRERQPQTGCQGARAAPARQRTGRAANGHQESSQGPPGAESGRRSKRPCAQTRPPDRAPGRAASGGPKGAGRRWRSDTIPCPSDVPSDRF